ncbi:MAG TPA: ABC transporter permease [Thermoplasmata archaeon]|nr:ABC transporter permease [Thermoplasmata archaeon]
MTTYIIRRLFLVLPVLLGVITITFLLFQALPVTDQLAAHFGNPPRNHPCAFESSCPCNVDNPGSVAGNLCSCYGSSVLVTINTPCVDSFYKRYVDKLGLNEPVWTQWLTFTYRALTFQWGTVENDSNVAHEFGFLKNLPVTKAFSEFLPYTLELAALSLILILVISIPVGNLAAVNRNRPIDQASRIVSFSGYALPGFLLGSLLIIGVVLLLRPYTGVDMVAHTPWCKPGEYLVYEFQGSWPQGTRSPKDCYQGLTFAQQAANGGYPTWLIQGYHSTPTGFPTVDALIHGDYWLALDTIIRMLLPALVIAFGTIAGVLRFVRNSMLEVMNLDFVRTARAKGASERTVVKRHAGRNSLNVSITVLGITFASFIGGFPVIESVFNLYGVGLMLAVAVTEPLSFAVIFGSTILFTWLVVFANIIVDVLYAYLDPRVRLG